MAACGGKLFDVASVASLADDCFVDFMHLNGQGARRLTDLFIAWRRGASASGRAAVDCAAPIQADAGAPGLAALAIGRGARL